MTIALGPPLVRPEFLYRGDYAVTLRLDEPLVSSKDLRQLLTLCTIADAAVERVQKQPQLQQHFDVELLQRIETLCRHVDPSAPAQELLQRLGILGTFPYLSQALSGQPLVAAPQNPGASYLNYVSLVNQCVMMSTQLYHDATVPEHHKYCAHQIALLYQCLNMLQGETKPVRKLIEARFDEIKTITESKSPTLDIELSQWLQEITWLCREEIKNCPPYVHKKLNVVAGILHTRC